MQVELVIAKGKHRGKTVRVKKTPFLIGRHEICNFSVSSSKISARHAAILLRDDGPWIRDLDSTNGTSVNDERVTADRALKHGDRLTIGPLVVEVVIEDGDGSRKSERSASDSDAADILLSASSKYGEDSARAMLGIEDSE